MTAFDTLQDHVRERALARATIATELTVQATQEAAPRRGGALVASISADGPSLTESRVVSQISATEPYALYQDVGTGVFGPTGMRIVPRKPGGVLRFEMDGVIVFARSVAGSPPTHFFSQPMPERWHNALIAAGEIA